MATAESRGARVNGHAPAVTTALGERGVACCAKIKDKFENWNSSLLKAYDYSDEGGTPQVEFGVDVEGHQHRNKSALSKLIAGASI